MKELFDDFYANTLWYLDELDKNTALEINDNFYELTSLYNNDEKIGVLKTLAVNATLEYIKQKGWDMLDRKILISILSNYYDDLYDTYKAKNKAYGDSFTISLNKFGIQASYTRISDKINRFNSLMENEDIFQGDESIADTLSDLINYCVMTVKWLENQEGRSVEEYAVYRNDNLVIRGSLSDCAEYLIVQKAVRRMNNESK